MNAGQITFDFDKINHLQRASMEKILERCKHAHHTNIVIRINGENEVYEADWIKHLHLNHSA